MIRLLVIGGAVVAAGVVLFLVFRRTARASSGSETFGSVEQALTGPAAGAGGRGSAGDDRLTAGFDDCYAVGGTPVCRDGRWVCLGPGGLLATARGLFLSKQRCG